MNSRFGEIIEKRRSVYSIKKESPISDEELQELIKHAVKYTPTAHNTQLTRVVLLLMGAHDEFWSMVMEAIREQNPGKDMSSSERKIQTFKGGYGTALFYNDTAITKQMMEEMPLYKTEFKKWADHANAMLQFSVWNMLEEAGFGASLQHYNPIVDSRVRKKWDINKNWELIAQMPFGLPYEEPEDKEFVPIDERFFVYD